MAAQLLSPIGTGTDVSAPARPTMVDRIPGSPRRIVLPFEGSRPSRVELVLRLAPGDDARIGLLARSHADPREWMVVEEVTAGNPGACTYPPTLCEAAADSARATLVLEGLGLDRVGAVQFHHPKFVGAISLPIVSHSARRLECALPPSLERGMASAYLRDSTGRVLDEARMEVATVASEPDKRMLVWLVAGAGPPELAMPAQPIPVAAIRDEALRALLLRHDVQSLNHAFPPNPPREPVRRVNELGEPVEFVDLSDVYLIEAPATTSRVELEAALRASPVVRAASASTARGPVPLSDDPLFIAQWQLRRFGTWDPPLCGDQTPDGDPSIGWAAIVPSPRADGIGIVFIDSGESPHEDVPTWEQGQSFVSTEPNPQDYGPGHGLKVAGVAAAETDNVLGIAGAAPGVTRRAFKIFDRYEETTWHQIASAVNATTSTGDAIATLAVGGDYLSDVEKQALGAAMRNAFMSGVLLVAGTGNANQSHLNWPATSECAFGIGAMYMTRRRWNDQDFDFSLVNGSNYGPNIAMVAPGGAAVVAPKLEYDYLDRYEDVYSCTILDPAHAGFGGTSSAVPLVAGAAAVLKHRQPTLTNEDLEAILQITARDVEATGVGWDVYTGPGYLRLDGALAAIDPPNALIHRLVGPSLAVVDSVTIPQFELKNAPPFPNRQYTATKVRLRGHASWQAAFSAVPRAWVRSRGTLGWRDTTKADNILNLPTARILPGTVTAEGADVETFCYRLMLCEPYCYHVGWFPAPPEQATVALTALGPSPLTGVDEELEGSSDIGGLRIAPNPVMRSQSLDISAPAGSAARVGVYDLTGRLVTEWRLPASSDAGRHLRWDLRGLDGKPTPAGVYFVRMSVDGRPAWTTRVVLVR